MQMAWGGEAGAFRAWVKLGLQTGEAQATLPVSVCMLYVDEYGSVWIGRALLIRRVFSQAYLSAS